MTDRKNMSMIELAYVILKENKKAMTFLDLFKKVAKEKDLSDEEKSDKISQVYADFVSSGSFIYIGEDEWDIKGRQAIDLWDKDGAYYDEYPDYEEELSLYEDETLDEEEDEEEVSQYEKDYDESDVKDEEDELIEDFEDELTEEEEELYSEFEEDEDFKDDEEEFEEFEEFEEDEEEFDDEEYNEYMDDYEEMYED
ncbi:MAG: DNA-directed RNA polymerase subunit delta [Bacillota bacterium]